MIRKEQLRIIDCLRKDARMTLTDMSRETGVPVSTIFGWVRGLEQEGLVQKHVSLINFGKAGYPFHLKVAIDANRNLASDLTKWLASHEATNSIERAETYEGDVKVLAEFVFRDIAERNRLMAEIRDHPACDGIAVHHITDVVKREGFVPREN